MHYTCGKARASETLKKGGGGLQFIKKKAESSLSLVVFVIWHGFFAPHLNIQNRWSRGGERHEEEESCRNCRDNCLLNRQPLERGQIRSRRIDIYLESLGEVVGETQQETCCGERGDSEEAGQGKGPLNKNTKHTYTNTHPWPRQNALFIWLLDETVAASATDLLWHVAKLLTSCRSFTRVPVCTRTHVSKKDVDQHGECVLNNIQLHCSLFLHLRVRN